MTDPFDFDLDAEYELAISIGDKRFGSPCQHEKVKAGRCVACRRKVVTGKSIVARRTCRIPQPLDWAANDERQAESEHQHADDANEHRNEHRNEVH